MAASARKATVLDAVRLSRNMRACDREEARASTRIPIVLLLAWAVLRTEVVALYAENALLALYGVRDVGRGEGLIWMLSTRNVVNHKREVMQACAAYVSECALRFNVLSNHIHVNNPTAVRFVERLGFYVGEPIIARGATWRPIVRYSCAHQ